MQKHSWKACTILKISGKNFPLLYKLSLVTYSTENVIKQKQEKSYLEFFAVFMQWHSQNICMTWKYWRDLFFSSYVSFSVPNSIEIALNRKREKNTPKKFECSCTGVSKAHVIFLNISGKLFFPLMWDFLSPTFK